MTKLSTFYERTEKMSKNPKIPHPNYELLMEKTLQRLAAAGQRPRLLLHACCAPCSSATLERLAGLIRERMRISGKLHAITAMGRMQAWLISLMPFLLLIGIHFVAPGLLDGVFDSMIGYLMIAVVVLLVTIGFLVIRKITTIDI